MQVGVFEPIALGARDVGPVDAKIFGILVGDALFGILQAEGVEERIGDVGEGGGTADADEVLTGKFEDLGQELADLVDFGDFAELGGKFGEGIGRWWGKASVSAQVSGAEISARDGYRLATLPSMLVGVIAGGQRIHDLSCVVRAFHFGTPVIEVPVDISG